MKMVIVTMNIKVCTMHYLSTKWLKYSNCTVRPPKYLEENQEIYLSFHHHHQGSLIHYLGQDHTLLLMDAAFGSNLDIL